jgi:hypothetical protein
MVMSAERMAIANRAIRQTFDQTSVAWQAIPHWDTGDPGQVRVRKDVVFTFKNTKDRKRRRPKGPVGGGSLKLAKRHVSFALTLAQATADTPDALLAAVLARAAQLARLFDTLVLGTLGNHALAKPWNPKLIPSSTEGGTSAPTDPGKILAALITARALVEDAGYRAPSCLIASTDHFIALSQMVNGEVVTAGLLAAANVNSLHRSSQLDGGKGGGGGQSRMLLLGRRQPIAPGGAGAASPGEEPVDLAISVPPSLEVVGENADGTIELAVRVRFATRVKDARGVVVFHD